MLKLSKFARTFLENNNRNLLLLLEDAQMNQEASPQIGQLNSDDEPDYSKPSPETQEPTPEQQVGEQGQPGQPGAQQEVPEEYQPTEEDILNQELNIADQKYIQFRLYDKIVELQETIEVAEGILFYTAAEKIQIENFKNYITILNELIFSIDINSIYQLIGQIEIDLITFFQNVNERLKALKLQKTNILN